MSETNSSPTSFFDNPAIYSQLDDLLQLRFHVKRLRLNSQQRLISEKAGYRQAIRKGRGMEFNEVREYSPGDDIRHIDWKVSARTRKYHTKLFTEELERPVLCILEQSPKLFFGSQTRFKSVQALNIAATLGWVTLQEGDRFGGYVFNHLGHKWIEPKHQAKNVLQFLNAATTLQQQVLRPGTRDNWQHHLTQVLPYLKSGTRVYLIGDFLDMERTFFDTLSHFKRQCEIVLIHVFDPVEADLPSQGILKLTDGENQTDFDTFSSRQLADYHTQYASKFDALQQLSYSLQIPMLSISTQENVLESLRAQKVVS
ncbi:DUF58 domain-containing protein [Hydrogenovibrio sp. JE_KL2]|nr:DUF58 domain-containing protein [Hydrogenovibrio sp. JE_KL2]